MFRINQLPRNVLITPDEVIASADFDQAPGTERLLKAIQVAEERFVKPCICRDLYDAFRNKKNVEVTDLNKALLEGADYFNTSLELGQIANAIELVDDAWMVSLWNEHLWKLTAECVKYAATVPNWSRFSAAGEMINNPKTITEGAGAQSVDLSELKFKLNKMQQDVIDPLIASTQEYLVINRGHFPLFNCQRHLWENDKESGISVARKTGWIHIYDRHREHCDHDHY